MMTRTIGAVAIVCAAVLSAGCGFSLLNIEGHAMEPALPDGSRAWFVKHVDGISRLDIVAFRYPRDESKNFVKRVIGLPGERIASVNETIFVNDAAIDEPYVSAEGKSHDTWGPITLGENEYFMMGDKRNNSSDSRHWGPVKREAVWAKEF